MIDDAARRQMLAGLTRTFPQAPVDEVEELLDESIRLVTGLFDDPAPNKVADLALARLASRYG